MAGPAAVITAITLIMLGAMAFAVPPARIEVEEGGHQRGYLVPHSQFSPGLALNVAADGYTYLAIDLTTADTTKGAHWSMHLDRVNEVQYPVWGWIELGGAAEQEAIRLAQVAAVEHASAKALVKNFEAKGSLTRDLAKQSIAAVIKAKGKLTGDKLEAEVEKQLNEHLQRLVDVATRAATQADRAQDAANRASADWKLRELVPGLNLQGFYIVGPGAVARARELARAKPSWTVLPVVTSDEGAHAVPLEPDAFEAGAKQHDYPILLATEIALKKLAALEKIEQLRNSVDGNYLVATIAVAK